MEEPVALSFLDREVMNHYPLYGYRKRDEVSALKWSNRRPYRTTGLPAWQLAIIDAYPDLYRSPDDMGVPDYCHLPFGFEAGSHWSRRLTELSRTGSAIVYYLRSSEVQPEATIVMLSVWNLRDCLTYVRGIISTLLFRKSGIITFKLADARMIASSLKRLVRAQVQG